MDGGDEGEDIEGGWGVREVMMKYSESVLLDAFLFSSSTSGADRFSYWGPCGSRNSFAGVLPLHTKHTEREKERRMKGGRERERELGTGLS